MSISEKILAINSEVTNQADVIASIISALSNKAYSCEYTETEVRAAIAVLESM